MNTNAQTLPMVSLGPYQVSRLIIGDNPIYGYSHWDFSKWGSPQMRTDIPPQGWMKMLAKTDHSRPLLRGSADWKFKRTNATAFSTDR